MIETQAAIILHSTPYLGQGKIIKAFSQNSGLISFLSKKTSLAHLSPFCIAECVYKLGKTDLHLLTDGSLIDSLLELRASYPILSHAGMIVQDLIRSQLPGKGSPALYSLLKSYLKQLPKFPHPPTLLASFRIKLLLHEGLIAPDSLCCKCAERAFFLVEGESLCNAHAPPSYLPYTPTQWQTLLQLAFARQFSVLQNLEPLPCLEERIRHLFEERINQ